ncbi:NAD(P)/FAD-dependent oxidoreductase [Thalassospira marina]|uniref:FAD-dependent oxidoreductase n=1 Tax=Thalassospira marina TaxID=2048283 RepID=A0A2N3KRE8_9PROT|nr:NAD(P)/FAD-dependent oxidoreductase [Thalassospira marina]PKR53132.1 FAD-dependent oxidoreductase [Thalassospira marina]
MDHYDIAIIGAGPAGAVAAKFLHDAGLSVIVLEATHFPRFVIGESLLPFCMNVLEKCGLADTVTANAANQAFQYKNGAAFARGEQHCSIDFHDRFESDGWSTTFQVKRDAFDKTLIDAVIHAGVTVKFGHRVVAAKLGEGDCTLGWQDDNGNAGHIHAGFVVDASGYGRVIPKLLGQANIATMQPRRALFTHIRDNITAPDYDREKILITVHPEKHDIWYWLIPFGDGTSSLGVVYPLDETALPTGDASSTENDAALFDRLLGETALGPLLAHATHTRPLAAIAGYSTGTERLYGDGYVLLGNSAGFLDPVFSSGVTIALYSAELAANALIARQKGNDPDWENSFAKPLSAGIATFKSYVDAWYDGRLQQIIFNQPDRDLQLKRMVVSILAGYAWNMENPLVAKTDRYLNLLHELSL